MSEKLQARLEAFAHHRPSDEAALAMIHTRKAFRRLVNFLDLAVPECREKLLAFTALEESGMWAMKALSVTDVGGEIVDPPQAVQEQV